MKPSQSKSGHDQITCVCGAVLKRRGLKMHTLGIRHRQGRRIKALLSKTCISHREISRRCDVSFERVRQVAIKMGFDSGLARKQSCTVHRIDKAKKSLERTGLLKDVRAIATRNGLAFETIATHKHSVQSPIFRRTVLIANQICALRTTSLSTGRNAGNVLVRPQTVAPNVDFVCLYIPGGHWMVIPVSLLPDRVTMFRMNLKIKAGSSNRHDWRDYIEAWHLLTSASAQAA